MTSQGLFQPTGSWEGILALALWQVSKTTIVMSTIEIPGNYSFSVQPYKSDKNKS